MMLEDIFWAKFRNKGLGKFYSSPIIIIIIIIIIRKEHVARMGKGDVSTTCIYLCSAHFIILRL
jgi:hypothetical protein